MTLPQDLVFQNVKVLHTDMGGWLRFFPDPESSDVPDLPVYLSYALTQFLRSRPHLRIWLALTVVKDGNTAELHAWYEQQLFPNASAIQSHDDPK